MENNKEKNSFDLCCCLIGCPKKEDHWDKEKNDCTQKHVHEIVGSVKIAEREEDPHNHRFATVSGQAISIDCGDHVHEVDFRTDFYENHFHLFKGISSGMIPVGGGRHVHFAMATTTINDGHNHDFRVASLINDPIGD